MPQLIYLSQGDSGGPMSCNNDGKWYAAGLTSFGPFFCFLMPAVYTRISHYHDWIIENISNNVRTLAMNYEIK